jgi:cell division cycle protein 37
MSPFYYSQISDDEDDTHPNVDTPSLFKWRHEARVERMSQQQKEKEAVLKEKKEFVHRSH